MDMATLHFSPLHFAWHRGAARFHRNQVRTRSLAAGASAAAGAMKPLEKPNFWVDNDSEQESSDEEEENPNDFLWVRNAREAAVQAMTFRGFTVKDYEALLPAKLRPGFKKKRRPMKRLPKREDPWLESMKEMRKQQKQLRLEQKLLNDKRWREAADEPSGPVEPVQPEALEALASKFNAAREAEKARYSRQIAENYEKLYGKPLAGLELQKQPQVPQVDFTVVYPDDGDSNDEDVQRVVVVKDTRMLEINLNQDLVECRDVDEVLEAVAIAKERFRLSPINVATALHRVAKHMETAGMSETKRLRLARQKEMCELVALGMQLLRDCSAQGLSNIAWALSKVGGSLLYSGEMDLLARVAASKCDEFNPQNVANMAGAFAIMLHDSPRLFERLASRAAEVARELRAQELSQLLWAFASMDFQPVTSLLDALDGILLDEHNNDGHFLSLMKLEDLASIAWSYAVFGQLQRPFFAHICSEIVGSKLNDDSSQTGEHSHACQLSQLHQAGLSLRLEWSHLGLSLGSRVERLAQATWDKEKKARKSTSLLQKDMERFLFYTGRKWIPEHREADYSLDFALVENKLGLEVNGPTHFSRNSGKPLGHMVLKRRLMQASGWTILSASYNEWEILQTEEEQIDYVKNLVSPHLEYHHFPVKNRDDNGECHLTYPKSNP